MIGKKTRLEWIIKTCKEQKITGYEIGKETVLSSFAATKILSGRTKNPNQSTIDIIEFYLRKKLSFSVYNNIERKKLEAIYLLESIIKNLKKSDLELVEFKYNVHTGHTQDANGIMPNYFNSLDGSRSIEIRINTMQHNISKKEDNGKSVEITRN